MTPLIKGSDEKVACEPEPTNDHTGKLESTDDTSPASVSNFIQQPRDVENT